MAMTKDQIDELMRENGIVIVGEAVYALCNLVEEQSAAAEREECVKLCNWLADRYPETNAVSCSEIISIRGSDGL
jgi:hypothetical protein